jgi:hypothetical protein
MSVGTIIRTWIFGDDSSKKTMNGYFDVSSVQNLAGRAGFPAGVDVVSNDSNDSNPNPPYEHFPQNIPKTHGYGNYGRFDP